MGQSVTVAPGYDFVSGPSPTGMHTYRTGKTIVYTDAEYAALPASVIRCLALSTLTTVAEPVRSSFNFSIADPLVGYAQVEAEAVVAALNALHVALNALGIIG